MALELAFQLRSLDMVSSRNLKLPNTSIRWPSMNKRSKWVLFLQKSLIISLGLEALGIASVKLYGLCKSSASSMQIIRNLVPFSNFAQEFEKNPDFDHVVLGGGAQNKIQGVQQCQGSAKM